MKQSHQHTIVLQSAIVATDRFIKNRCKQQRSVTTCPHFKAFLNNTVSGSVDSSFKKLLISAYENTWPNAKNYKLQTQCKG